MTMVREWTQDKLETNNEWSHCSFLERARGGWSKVYWRNLYKYFGGWNNEVWYGTCSGFCEGYTYHGVWNCINKMPEFCHHSGCGGAVGGWLVCASIRFDQSVFLKALGNRRSCFLVIIGKKHVWTTSIQYSTRTWNLQTTEWNESINPVNIRIFYNTTRFVPPPVFAMLEVSLDFDGFPEMMLQYVTWRLVMLDDIFILW